MTAIDPHERQLKRIAARIRRNVAALEKRPPVTFTEADLREAYERAGLPAPEGTAKKGGTHASQ